MNIFNEESRCFCDLKTQQFRGGKNPPKFEVGKKKFGWERAPKFKGRGGGRSQTQNSRRKKTPNPQQQSWRGRRKSHKMRGKRRESISRGGKKTPNKQKIDAVRATSIRGWKTLEIQVRENLSKFKEGNPKCEGENIPQNSRRER